MWFTRIVSTGEVLGAEQSTKQDADWLKRYAEALGITVKIEQFESDDDPRKPDAKTEPPSRPPTTVLWAEDEAIEALASATTIAQVKAALTDYFEAVKG